MCNAQLYILTFCFKFIILLCRNRIVCYVSIIEKFQQTVVAMMKTFRHGAADCHATYTYETASFYLVIFVCVIE